MVRTDGLIWQPLKLSQGDLDFQAFMTEGAKAIMSAFYISPDMIGDLNNTNRPFPNPWRPVSSPRERLRETISALNNKLARMAGDDSQYLVNPTTTRLILRLAQVERVYEVYPRPRYKLRKCSMRKLQACWHKEMKRIRIQERREEAAFLLYQRYFIRGEHGNNDEAMKVGSSLPWRWRQKEQR